MEALRKRQGTTLARGAVNGNRLYIESTLRISDSMKRFWESLKKNENVEKAKEKAAEKKADILLKEQGVDINPKGKR